ncbi:MAG: hypothetical protein LQ338_004730 [Usnochroma carphineum]|nr:MAG: hypothetical protein LQ338_004730 [Usnochroma carphineum]
MAYVQPREVERPDNLPDNLKWAVDVADTFFFRFCAAKENNPSESSDLLLHEKILQRVIEESKEGAYLDGAKSIWDIKEMVYKDVRRIMKAWTEALSFRVTDDAFGAMNQYLMNKRKEYMRIFLSQHQEKAYRDFMAYVANH